MSPLLLFKKARIGGCLAVSKSSFKKRGTIPGLFDLFLKLHACEDPFGTTRWQCMRQPQLLRGFMKYW